MARSEWQRLGGGYLRRDGEFFVERGAPMSTGGTNAWLIMRRVDDTRIGADGGSFYDEKDGKVLWRITEDGYTESCPTDIAERPDLYAHDWDAGSLAEAKYTITIVEGEDAA